MEKIQAYVRFGDVGAIRRDVPDSAVEFVDHRRAGRGREVVQGGVEVVCGRLLVEVVDCAHRRPRVRC